MQLTPEIKAQLEEQKKQCIFCKLISGEMQGKTVFQDNKAIAFLDIYPALKGHTVYMTKEHYPMPAYMPHDESEHMFALIPAMSQAIKSGMVRTGINVFVAIGGVAGQQSPHFLIHFLPRDEGDGFFNFMLKKGEQLDDGSKSKISQYFIARMGQHFKEHPAAWHSGKGDVPSYLTETYEKDMVVYEDEKILAVIPQESATKGHIIIYSKTQEQYVENLTQEESVHMWQAATVASGIVFEALGAHGTNIILKSGFSDDNPQGKLEVHVFPRWQDDSLKGLHWQPKQPSYDLDGVKSQIKDKTWKVKFDLKKEEKVEKVELPIVEEKKELSDREREIQEAIERMRG